LSILNDVHHSASTRKHDLRAESFFIDDRNLCMIHYQAQAFLILLDNAVDPTGFEPVAFRLQSGRSSS
jgi:hypothetical protein